MKFSDNIRFLILSIVFLLLQLVWFRYFVFLNLGYIFIYPAILLFLPLELGLIAQLTIAFALGMFVDVFYNTLGLHTLGCVVYTYTRPNLIRFLTPLGGYDKNIRLTIASMGWRWMLIYTSFSLFMIIFLFFTLEAMSFDYFYLTLTKIIFTTVLSIFTVLSMVYVFFTPSSGK